MAESGVGTVFKRSDMTSSPTFNAIAGIVGIDGPNKSKETRDTTTLDSTAGYREFAGSFKDGGEVTLDMHFSRDGYVEMDADFESDTLVDYQIVLPDAGATTLDFTALCTGLGLGISLEDNIMAPATFKISGKPEISS